MSERERCETCRYARVGRNYWHCRREPPRDMTTGNYGGYGIWPVVSGDDWCGEWREWERDPQPWDVEQR